MDALGFEINTVTEEAVVVVCGRMLQGGTIAACIQK